jgi:hypothetical protein
MMDLKKSSTSATNLQDIILEGRKILMKKPEGNYFIQIRFNHNDIDGTRRWRIVIDGIEFQVSEIMINIPCKTESELYEDFNGYKHNIVTDSTNEVIFEKTIAYLN